jgi:uncharacterized protein involved in type VI secretion and phage assembly
LSNPNTRFYGKYRGIVTDNRDPQNQGRIRARVPAVMGDQETGWALPCSPYAGNGVGFFFVPDTDSKVWIEFEAGNIESPIWTGGFWGIGEVPNIPAMAEIKMIKTSTATIKLDDTPGVGGITIETTSGMKIMMDSMGIEISYGAQNVKISSTNISVNNGALDIM